MAIAQWLEYQIVDLVVAGSNPVGHPKIILSPLLHHTIRLNG